LLNTYLQGLLKSEAIAQSDILLQWLDENLNVLPSACSCASRVSSDDTQPSFFSFSNPDKTAELLIEGMCRSSSPHFEA
jgi:hypothetical protein